MFTANVFGPLINAIDCCPWGSSSGRHKTHRQVSMTAKPLYTPEERQRRDATVWTLVQGILAPIQFLVFLISLGMVANFLITGAGQSMAEFSVVVKTLVLYTIMITGAIWEREVFGRYLFAPAFFWEDMVSMLVLTLHTAYLYALYTHALPAGELMVLALAAYATYVVNATQFVIKLRSARKQSAWEASHHSGRNAVGAA
jgi:3-vinyl bacteriochlorophyllide hydratase